MSSTEGLINPMIDSSPRKRRGLLDFGVELLHAVFCTVTDKSVEDCRRWLYKNNQKKASMELARLTEKLLPERHLQEILRPKVPPFLRPCVRFWNKHSWTY